MNTQHNNPKEGKRGRPDKDAQALKEREQDCHILARIKEDYDTCRTHYAKQFKRMRLLDATDRGELWKALKAKYPKYQILPDTNFVSYVKNNLLASIYTVMKGASIMPTSEKDKNLIVNLNVIMEYIWDIANVGYYQFMAGERASLLNLGITQVGWDDTLTGGNGDSLYKGNIALKNIDPMRFMMDPFCTSYSTAQYCMTFEKYHKNVLLKNPRYKEKAKEYFDKVNNSSMELPNHKIDEVNDSGAKDYATLVCYWCKEDGKVKEYHTLNCECMLYKNEEVLPAEFPFAILYSNLPTGDLVGTSECAKIFANNVAYNLLDSLAITAEYKNQRPPKFISTDSGLNVQAFVKHGDEAEQTFIVNGRADQAVHYHQFPQVSGVLPNLKMGLQNGVELTSGIDGRYTGRDTGSVLTTGGVQDMLNRVTLIDTPKITLYEDFTKQLTKLILANLIHFAPKRKYFVQEPMSVNWKTVEVDFPKIDNDTLFNYSINISSELPKNKERIAATADMLMEKQMQYAQQGNNVQLITEEEWLEMQDLPNKERMLERMGIQRQQNALEDAAQVIFQYADLMQQGVSPEDALMATAQTLQNRRDGKLEEPTIPGEAPMPINPGEGGIMPTDMPMGLPTQI